MKIVIKRNATSNNVIVNNETFDLSKMSNKQKDKFIRDLVKGYRELNL